MLARAVDRDEARRRCIVSEPGDAMEIEFKLSGEDSARELGLLYGWLADDRALRDEVRLEPLHEKGVPGEMGLGLEAVLALVSTAATLGQLPLSYAAWRDGHRPSSQTVIYVRDGGPEALRSVREAFPDAHVRSEDSDTSEEDRGGDDRSGEDGRSGEEEGR
jgi:hypothetical protein